MEWTQWAEPGVIVQYPQKHDIRVGEVFYIEGELIHIMSRYGEYCERHISQLTRHWPLTEEEKEKYKWKMEQATTKDRLSSLVRRLEKSRSTDISAEKQLLPLMQQLEKVFGSGIEIEYTPPNPSENGLPKDPHVDLPLPPL